MNKSKIVNIVIVILIIVVVALAIFVAFRKGFVKQEKPDFDPNAVATSDVKDLPDLAEMEQSSDFVVRALQAPLCDYNTGKALLYFTLPENDKVYAKCEIYVSETALSKDVTVNTKRFESSTKNTIYTDYVLIGESGLIRPGETLESIPLDYIPQKTTDVVVRYVSYVKDTYLSRGNFNQISKIFVVDNNGRYLDEEGVWTDAN